MDIDVTPAEVIAGTIHESEACPDIFEKEAAELAEDIIAALAATGFSITPTAHPKGER